MGPAPDRSRPPLLRRRGDRGARPAGSASRGAPARVRAPAAPRAGSQLPASGHGRDGAADDAEAPAQPARSQAGAFLVLTGEVKPAPGRYVAVEGVIGVGKTSLAKLLADRLHARLLLEEPEENPFLEDFYQDPRRHAFATQMWFLVSRYQELRELSQPDLFHHA